MEGQTKFNNIFQSLFFLFPLKIEERAFVSGLEEDSVVGGLDEDFGGGGGEEC